MPELPEVETVKESLKLRLSNKKIIRARVLWDNIIAYPSKDELIKEIANQTINDVKRRGKFLMFDLDDYFLLSHLRMEGKYFFKKSSDSIDTRRAPLWRRKGSLPHSRMTCPSTGNSYLHYLFFSLRCQ